MRLRDLAAAERLRLRVVAGEEGLDAVVRWVYTTELSDPSAYLSGGELVVTNALWYRPGGGARDFVRRVADGGAVGLVVGTGPSRENVPDDLIEAAREVGLPLLEAPADLSFSAINAMVADHYSEERSLPLVRALHRSQALAAALTAGGGIRELLRILERELGIASALYGPDGKLLAITGPPLSRTGAVGAIFPLAAFGHPGTTLVVDQPVEAFAPEARAALEQVMTFVSLELLRREAVRATEMSFAAELFDLVPDSESHAAEIEARLQSFGIDASTPMVTLLAGTQVPASKAELTRMRSAAVGAMHEDGIAHIAAIRDDELAIIASWPAGSRELTAFAHALRDGIAGAALSKGSPAIGVGSPADGVRALRRSLQEAHSALLRALHSGLPVATHADAVSYAALLAVHDAPMRESFCNAVIGPVEEYDRRRRTELLPTLRAFLRNSGAWQATAAELHIHPNTLRYRLRRVETLTGRDLSAMDERVNFHIALALAGE